jgi:hypothetical protein
MRTSRIVGIAVVAAGLVAGLGGCRYYWYKPQTTAEAFTKDSNACFDEARSATPATARYGIVNEQVYRACLQARGYERRNTTSGPDHYRGYEFSD